MALELAKALVNIPSITPEDNGCQDILAARLAKLNFNITHLPFGSVKNFWARYGDTGPLLAFVGHTDVVPTGPLSAWQFPPFAATEHEGYLYGRGVADMKSNIAAMIIACENFLAQSPHPKGSIGFLITSDEEGPSVDGTAKVVKYLQEKNIFIDYCIVGEPSSEKKLGDTLKIGRRGSLSVQIVIHGKQGHIAYPQLSDNPVHRALPALQQLVQHIWDDGNEFFPPTSFQISNIHAGTGANNVIPGTLEIHANFRYSPMVTAEKLQATLEKILHDHKLDFTLYWQLSGLPFLSPRGKLLKKAVETLQEIAGITPALSTGGGTSDARFIAPMGSEIIELGLINETIHQVNERVAMADIAKLAEIYQHLLHKLLTPII